MKIDLRILGSGANWINVSSIIALHLNGYSSPLGPESTISLTTMDPGVGSMRSPILVGEGKYDIGITTPGWYGALAREGLAPFERKQPISGIALLPHEDRMVFAVRRDSGIRSIREIKDRKYPLRYSIPLSETHPAIWGADEVLDAYGFSRADIDGWGGRRLRDRPRFQIDATAKPISDDWEAIFDEAIMTPRWQNIMRMYDVEILPIEEDVLIRLEARGFVRETLTKKHFPQLEADVPTLDFSGWLVFCNDALDEEAVYHTARVIDENRAAFNNRIPPHSGLTHPVDPAYYVPKMPIPLHPGAARYYREKGFLKA